VVLDFPVLQDLIDGGGTDYFVLPVHFSDGQVNSLAFTTKAPGGFTDDQCEILIQSARMLARPFEIMQMRDLATTLLETYVGRHAGERVLEGAITRGSGESIGAVIWYCDLRDFTPLSEQLPMNALIDVLNSYFEAVGVAIENHGGEVLKFVGDAILAIWPLENADDAGNAAAAALAAWRCDLRQYRRARSARLHRYWAGGKPGVADGGSDKRTGSTGSDVRGLCAGLWAQHREPRRISVQGNRNRPTGFCPGVIGHALFLAWR
jgi:adenylate cyclase